MFQKNLSIAALVALLSSVASGAVVPRTNAITTQPLAPCPQATTVTIKGQNGKIVLTNMSLFTQASLSTPCNYHAKWNGQDVWAMTTSKQPPFYAGTDGVAWIMSRNAYNGLESYKRDPDNTSEILGQGTQDVDSNSPDANRYWIIRKAHDRFAPLWETDVFFENVGRKSLLPAPGSPKSGPNCREFIQAAYTAIGVAAQQYAESTNNINNSPNLQYMLFYSMMPVKLGNNDLLPIFTEWTNMSPIPSNTGSAKPSYWAQETTVQQVQDADPIDSICN